MIIFMKQIEKDKFGREFREATEAVAETEAEAEKTQSMEGRRQVPRINDQFHVAV